MSKMRLVKMLFYISIGLAACWHWSVVAQLSWNNTATVFIDDMIFRTDNNSTYYSSKDQYPTIWTYGEVPYEISQSLYSYSYRKQIEDAMKYLESMAPCIRFVRYEPSLHTNYIYIDHKENQCASEVGMIGGKQDLFLDYGRCLQRGTILHELMHALGFYHHHTRPDRDDYLIVYYDNIIHSKKHNFAKLSPKQYRILTEFDYESIMIYGEYNFARNTAKPTMRDRYWYHTLENAEFKEEISLLDKQALQLLYNCI